MVAEADDSSHPPTSRDRQSRPRRLFLVANSLDELGGLQQVAHLLARLFAERGHIVDLCGISHSSEPFDFGPPVGYRTHDLYPPGVSPDIRPVGQRRTFDLVKRARARRRRRVFQIGVQRMRELFDDEPEAIVLCMQVWAMEWVAAAAPPHFRVIGQSHESFEASVGLTPATKGSTRYQRMLRLYRDIDSVLLLTRADADRFVEAGFDNIGVMHNPITMYPDRPAALDAPVVISVGRYAEQKNQRDLIAAFALIAQEHPDWRLKIFGSGHLQAQLQQQIDALGLGDRAFLMGPTSNVEQELLNSSIFALSSDFEGLPVVLAEAMSCGVPCVAYDCSPGITEIVTNEVDGVVVRPRTPAHLAQALSRLMSDDVLRRRFGSAARENIRRFRADVVLDRWEALFAEVER